ncbi:protoglobin domain-containing protein [Meiothermus taiwanensis]|uniref:Globin-coupled histidine kinase n=2 Tax=Meiothermus taiwanensis TaxID=172827 RepID=A0A399DUC0_9DEIN|nr:protoglobin domain-containing protein [Meiothermus taiwanensis]AWR86402.1 hypothetical protein Mtai_v1c11600 [Meiothermus taiwanensis WR-220]KIQ54255.1 hypothetical protein SY28_09495 [Meiothermus taiwanensis]KZK16490.1 hypothetical protein A3962_06100 [Meiothermus taiwanensis]RIH75269.1 Globin-coupled histidine kinase [Meiothermus taiwanensis]
MKAGELLQTLVRRTGLAEQHMQTLRSLEPIAGPLAPEVALAFYDYLGRDPEMHEILWSVPGRVERLYRSFAAWYRELFSGQYDALYAERRMHIGLVHARVGVRPSHYVPAVGIVQELTLEHLRNALRGSELLAAMTAFEKIMAVEIALMQESYLNALTEGLKYTHDERVALMEGARVLLEKAR